MRVRVTVEVDRTDREAIPHAYGFSGRATYAQVRSFIENELSATLAEVRHQFEEDNFSDSDRAWEQRFAEWDKGRGRSPLGHLKRRYSPTGYTAPALSSGSPITREDVDDLYGGVPPPGRTVLEPDGSSTVPALPPADPTLMSSITKGW